MQEEMLNIPQNIFIATVVKAITNIKTHKQPFALKADGVILHRDFNKRSVGTEYKVAYSKLFKDDKENKREDVLIGITFKKFFPDNEEIDNDKKQLYPSFTDKHLKMLIYFLEKKESSFEFLASDFNRACGLIEDSVNIQSAYKVLEDLLNIEIRIINSENELFGEMEFFPLLQLESKRTKVKNISHIKLLQMDGVVMEETLSRAKLKLTKLINFDNAGSMYMPMEVYKTKINNKQTLGATSIAYNIFYIASMDKKGVKNVITLKISTVLGWIGVTEEEYKNFFIKNKSKTHKYYVSRLNKIFQQLADCGISVHFKGIQVKNKEEFYNKEQVVFNLTDFKANLKKYKTDYNS